MKYIAEIRDAPEVALLVTADAEYWREQLRSQNLFPQIVGNRARLLISAVQLKWMGMRFRELIVALDVTDSEHGPLADSCYLLTGFNSSWLLALAERMLFRTPYQRAQVTLDHALPAHMAVSMGSDEIISARMNGERTAIGTQDQTWEGPIYLPPHKPSRRNDGEVFYARLSGEATLYPFTDADSLNFHPSADQPVIQQLIDSDCRGLQWRIRPRACHARSKTYRRTAMS